MAAKPPSVNEFLSKVTASKGTLQKSYYCACLRDARQITGRSLRTGVLLKKRQKSRGCWAGALCYLILIEHTGELWGNQSGSGKEFKWTLENFTTLSTTEIEALWALRNAFMHSYGLYNDKPPKHHFRLTAQSRNCVTLSSQTWSGQIGDITPYNATTVDVVALGDLVENIHKTLLGKAKGGALSLPQNWERYLIVYGDPRRRV